MRRNLENLEEYKNTCAKVMERADNRCEVLIEGKQCGKWIPFEEAKYINFLHKETRNGKSDTWVLDHNNIVFGCSSHHLEEERTGVRVKSIEYNDDNELRYYPE